MPSTHAHPSLCSVCTLHLCVNSGQLRPRTQHLLPAFHLFFAECLQASRLDTTHALRGLHHLVQADACIIPPEAVVLCQEQHAVALLQGNKDKISILPTDQLQSQRHRMPTMPTYLALPHGDTGAVPEALLSLQLLVIIVPAGTQWRAQLVLVLRKTLQTRCDLWIMTIQQFTGQA